MLQQHIKYCRCPVKKHVSPHLVIFFFIKLKEGVVLYELRQFSYVRQTIYKVIESSEKSIAAKLCLTGQQQYMSVLLQTKDTFKSVCVIQYVPIDMYTIHVISLSHDILCI